MENMVNGLSKESKWNDKVNILGSIQQHNHIKDTW